MDCTIPGTPGTPGTPGAQFECQHPPAQGLGGPPLRVDSAARVRSRATICQLRQCCQAAVAATL